MKHYSVKNNLMLKGMIAARARAAAKNKNFYKSYVSAIELAEVRPIPGHAAGFKETDYFFKYEGKSYRVNEYIVPDENGDARGSAVFRYELVEV